MPNIPPLITHMSQDTSTSPVASTALYAPYTPLPSGLITGITGWSSNTAGTDYSTRAISVPGVTATSVISAAVQAGTYTDTNAAWLMASVPSANTITFKVYTKPTDASYTIAWAVAKF
jgi:hypothetical protein